jgi:gliding motility-associated-like protein
MLSRKTFLLFYTLAFLSGSLKAQIFAPTATDSLTAFYGADMVFVFNRPEFNTPVTASIFAASADTSVFQWSVYIPADSSYRDIPGTSTGKLSAIDTITVSSGYQVQLTGNSKIDTFRVWIVINDLDVTITNKDEADTLLFGYYDCESLDLHADTIRPPAYYFNPETHQKLDIGNTYTLRWTTDNVDATVPSSRLLTRVSNPPWMDTRYILTITDRFGLERADSVIYNSIQPKAEITEFKYITLPEQFPERDWYKDFYDYAYISAPALYQFDISASRNFTSYEFDFDDGDSVLIGKDSLRLYHTFEKPGTYEVVLTTKSGPPFECTDSIVQLVEVNPATDDNFNMPNVFTPGNSGSNDVFRTIDVSVTYIDITIFSRTGLKVHQYEGNVRDWKGWDGKIMNSNRDAPEGVYFYVVSRLNAYQNKEQPIRKEVLNGFVHLYR